MITTIISIIDRLIQLITIRENRRKHFFKETIEPMMSDFDSVHNNYLEDFKKYRTMIISETQSLTPEHRIFSEMKFDSKLTIHIRKKLWDWDMLQKFPINIKPFFFSFERYFSDICFHKENEIIIPYNRFRNALYLDLQRLFSESVSDSMKKKNAEIFIEEAIDEIQGSYNDVRVVFLNTKEFFLAPTKI